MSLLHFSDILEKSGLDLAKVKLIVEWSTSMVG